MLSWQVPASCALLRSLHEALPHVVPSALGLVTHLPAQSMVPVKQSPPQSCPFLMALLTQVPLQTWLPEGHIVPHGVSASMHLFPQTRKPSLQRRPQVPPWQVADPFAGTAQATHEAPHAEMLPSGSHRFAAHW